MKYFLKKAWPVWGIVLFTLVLNVLIFIAAGTYQVLLWALVVFSPVFLFTAFLLWQRGFLPQKASSGGLQPSAKPDHYEWLSHSVYPARLAPVDLEVKIGNDQCSRPYHASIVNVDSMENIDQQAIPDYAGGGRDPDYPGYPGSGGLDTYQLAAGSLVWQIDAQYRGCRGEDGHFNSKAFKANSGRPEIKMIELKLSSAGNTNDAPGSILQIGKGIEHKTGNGIFLYAAFTSFHNAEGMIHFLNNLRELSDGKPVGIRICLNNRREFYQICHAIQKTQLIPDFIVVDGGFERADTDPSVQSVRPVMPLYEALLFVSQTLQMYGFGNKIKIIADGRIHSSFDIIKVLALGADVICTEIPHYRIMKHAGKVSLHFSSQDEYEFHNELMKDTVQMMKSCGCGSIRDITLSKLFSRLDVICPGKIAALNGHVSQPGTVRKIYDSKIRSIR